MINKSVNIRNQFEKQPVEPIEIDNNTSTFVVPWVLRSGYQNVSEKGYLSNSASAIDSSFFQKVFTGRDSIIATWEGSTTLQKPLAENKLKYRFQVGKYYLGLLVGGSTTTGTDIGENEMNRDFLEMKQSGDIAIRFELSEPCDDIRYEGIGEHEFFITSDDMYKLYTIPEIGDKKWYYISSCVPLIQDNTNLVVGFDVIFSTLEDKLSKTGRAIEQYVQYAAIGEPYALPDIEEDYDEDTNTYTRTLRLNSQEIDQNKLCNALQVELQGSAALSAITVIGRKLSYVEDSENDGQYVWESEPWEFLLPYRFYTPQINPLNKTAIPSNTYYVFPKEEITNFISTDELASWKNQNSALTSNESAGRFSLGNSNQWTTSYTGSGNFVFTPTAGLHYSNLNTNSSTLRYTIIDQTWLPFSNTHLALYLTSINTSQSMYVDDTLRYLSTDSINNILVKNSFAYLTQLELPLSYLSTKPYRLSNLPIIGGMVSALIGDRVLASNWNSNNTINVCYMMDCSLAEFLQAQGSAGQTTNEYYWAYLSSLGGKQIPEYLGASQFNTSLNFQLTNRFSCYVNEGDEERTTLRTMNLGQKTYENGDNIKSDGTRFFLPNDFTLLSKDSDTQGFAIDKIIVQGLFSGDIRISAFNDVNEDTPIFNTTIISTAKWLDNSYRSWTTEITTGTWTSDWIEKQDDFTYPTTPSKTTTEGQIDINQEITQPIVNYQYGGIGKSYYSTISDWTLRNCALESEIKDTYTYPNDLPLFFKRRALTISESVQISDLFADEGLTTWSDVCDNYESIVLNLTQTGTLRRRNHWNQRFGHSWSYDNTRDITLANIDANTLEYSGSGIRLTEIVNGAIEQWTNSSLNTRIDWGSEITQLNHNNPTIPSEGIYAAFGEVASFTSPSSYDNEPNAPKCFCADFKWGSQLTEYEIPFCYRLEFDYDITINNNTMIEITITVYIVHYYPLLETSFTDSSLFNMLSQIKEEYLAGLDNTLYVYSGKLKNIYPCNTSRQLTDERNYWDTSSDLTDTINYIKFIEKEE